MISGGSCESLAEFGRIVSICADSRCLRRRGRAVWRAAVGERFGEMHATGRAAAVKVGECAGKLKHAMIASRRKTQPLGCVAQQRQT